ncbi:MAG: GNAT family N-acetyltransferase [Planctomycetes bacterium]|nr:GNAT family N-acetyltransferase [Planctomycetota bacterium]
MTELSILIEDFDRLEVGVVDELFALRRRVFVEEQDCDYEDRDGRDPGSRQVLGQVAGRLVACARILAERDGLWIGRIAVAPEARGAGFGRAIVAAALAAVAGDPRPRLMHAQAQLEDFYAAFGFRREGRPFLEDGIPHLLMRRPGDDAAAQRRP